MVKKHGVDTPRMQTQRLLTPGIMTHTSEFNLGAANWLPTVSQGAASILGRVLQLTSKP